MNTQLKDRLNEYAELIAEIRLLSAVTLDDTSGSEDYEKKLAENFKTIGAYGLQSRRILTDHLYPLLAQIKPFDRNTVNVLQDFCDLLLDPPSGEELDLFLLYEVSRRLLTDPTVCEDDDLYARQLNMHISTCYSCINRCARVTVTRDITDHFQKQGLRAAEEALKILDDRPRYLALSEVGKSYILRAVRFYSALYDTFYYTEDSNRARYEALVYALRISEDAWYRDCTPAYDWKLHRIRCLEHMGQLTERGNRWGFSQKNCRQICSHLSELKELHDSDPEAVRSILPEEHYQLILLRNSYFAGEISVETYRNRLLSMYGDFSGDSYDMYGVQMNLLLPVEYMSTLRGERFSTKTDDILQGIYDRVLDYIRRSANNDAFNFLQEYLMGFLEEFIELPGRMTFADVSMRCLAALHPVTYVHCLQVADITLCLTRHLLKAHPELFAEELRHCRRADVANETYLMLQRAYDNGLYHDMGKITMIDTIFTYGRDLLEREFELIRLHPEMGSMLLKKHTSTKAFAEVARTHHIWYDCTDGYPAAEDHYSVFSSLVEAADCIDAATDSIGRSYRSGKGFEEICDELNDGINTHYAPFIAELLGQEQVKKDLLFLLTEGRRNQYRNAYITLSDVINHGG